jgi:aminoglycoside phosphotransferase (APT) family kinase protein
LLERLDVLEKDVASRPDGAELRRFDAAVLAAYLSRKYGGPITVAALGSPIGGFSKDVFVVTLEGAARPAERVVIRRDLPNGPLEGSVTDELAVLQAAQAAGVPVALPWWIEPDPEVFGGPTLCLQFVAGEPVANARAEIPAERAAASFRQLAQIMAKIHRIDPVAVGLLGAGADRNAAAQTRKLLDDFATQWRRRRSAENIVVAAAFAWMQANVPTEDIPLAVVHGDCSLRNLMVHDGRPTALLDWETWHCGDPAEDLAYVRDEVEKFMTWAEFMAEYRAAGGPDISEQRLGYWSLWRELRGTVTSMSMMDGVPKGTADLRTAFGGLFFTPMLLAIMAKRLQQLLAR